MLVRPTVALYAPFYLSSAGYGLYVATTAPGSYDVGDSDPDALRFRFEAIGVPEQRALRYSLFVGAPAAVLDEYTRLTGRPFRPPDWALRHWRWRGELALGEPADLDGAKLNAQVAEDLRMYEKLGIPAGVYLIDRPWSPGEFGFESFRWDEQRLPNPEAMLASLARRGWKLALWSAAFAVGENLEKARAQRYLAPGSDLVLDLTNPEARDWWKREHVAFVRRWNVAAIKLDRGEEQIPSEATDLWFDGRSGRELRNAYPRAPARALPGDPARGARRRLPGDRARRLRRRPAARRGLGRRHPRTPLHRPRAQHRPGPAQRDPGRCCARASWAGRSGARTPAATTSSPAARSSRAGSSSAPSARSWRSAATARTRPGRCRASRTTTRS